MHPNRVYSVIDRCAGWLWPPQCVLCRRAGQRQAIDLCAACEAEFPVIAMPCARCGLPWTGDDHGAVGCDRCRSLALPYARCVAPWAYEFPVTHLVQALKYEGALANARILGIRIAAAGRPALAQLADPTARPLLVPLPLHPSRLVERGFNQSREIARIVARNLDLRLDERALRRVRATAPQVGLARLERASNLGGAFAADAGIVAGRTIILVDDVVTTGSTAAEAARTLLAADAQSVQVWAAARALG
jgi:ComF family protein